MNILIKLINDVKALCNSIITAVNAIKTKTDTITADLFTATHASRIDATISSRQANAGLTTTHASRIDKAISSRRGVYSKVVSGYRYQSAVTIDASFVTLLDISGKGGILRNIYASCVTSYPDDFIVQITIDGVVQSFSARLQAGGLALQANPQLSTLAKVYQPLAGSEIQGSTEIPIDLEFSTSCKVELKATKAQANALVQIIATAHTE